MGSRKVAINSQACPWLLFLDIWTDKNFYTINDFLFTPPQDLLTLIAPFSISSNNLFGDDKII